ncbi:thiamine pyrophosphate-dependent dehydrogenase E1 component subunit alpha [Halalkalicoccus jeotgali]|uniref:2-oxoacid dehydrogenase E1 component alpha subunit n=1 Tax=Halalkalicoccus jeotgali (strain DSM 18796 / CECT 7217 / JCM 14584 / KCTC 4019 / B3) TaxID=795797 RepID=D8J9H2_HALJB|nr:thiamine pyrophosphate-dependent dehydrogenase E1 component subunit alpha [Halalkalicoccus jeotgali]ADJ14384.1 2-oxoacid dehydrogenase E1 component alpha subunit [Halalkalicoccus jeotgali B3]ELY40645.1 2-oxoacid dehydrogenase E1 component subunit alpha [Halalkalicoccus jeotgali B3]
MYRVIDDHPLAATDIDEERARALYRDMVRARRFDERAIALQRRGWMSGYPPFAGQEASQVGAAHAMAERDWLVPTYRQNATQIARGVPMSDLFRFRRGHPEFASDHDLPTLPQTVPIASQLPHAVGLGMAIDYRDDEGAVLCCFGDGATSEGDFHEALNFAGVFSTPTVFFCENNGWAISLPQERQTASDSIAIKADAYGITGTRVDGNDPLAVYAVVREALSKAREGEPVLIESLTYRRGAHTTSDDPSRYRSEDAADLPEWRTADPLERYETYLREEGLLDGAFVEGVEADADEELRGAVERAESGSEARPEAVFDTVFKEVPPRLARQRDWLLEHARKHDSGRPDR